MIWKRLRKVLAASAVTLALVSGAAVSASADTTGGIGGGGGGGGAYSGFEWVSVVGQKGAAYNEFVRLGKWGGQTDGLVNNRIGGNGVGVCQNSNVIWFIRSAQGGWTYNYTGATHGQWAGNVHGTIENPYSQYGGRGPIAAETQAFKDWDAGQNGRKIDGTPGYTIICSGKFMQDDKNWTTSSTRYVDSDDSATYTAPYSWSTAVKRQALNNDPGYDPIGVANLEDQAATTTVTAFGSLYNKVNTTAGAGISVADLRNQVAAAQVADSAANHSTVDLSAKNKAGMAEGGILNVIESVLTATITAKEHTRTTITTTCNYNQTWNSYWAVYNGATSSCRDTSSTAVTRNSSKVQNQTPEVKGFWQMLSVHCNLDEFNALLASDPSLKKIQTPDASNKMSGVVYSKVYDHLLSPRELAFAPSGVPMKGVAMPDPAKVRTGDLGFYDKECPFDCTNNAKSSGASAANGATGNAGAPGAVSNKVNSNAFEFFRDNSPKDIAVDTWFPVSGNGVDYKGEAPLTTTVTRDVNGTPSLDGSGGGKFTMKSSKDGTTLFTGTATAVNTQKNWDASTFSGSMATILNGLHNKFTVQSTWASDAGKPQAFNFKWEYAPNVSTTVPLTGIGFGPGSSQKVGTTGNVTTPIQGKCYTYFGTPANPDMTALFGSNTGTGTENNIDGHLLADSAAKLTTNFVRSTTE